ncbi:MAG: hypothetical protein C0485_07880 [Pirellula sp.]|nr:hypothetical protein [Pirellula sp.]
MEYRWEATSITGFVQILACNYLPHGYWFYVSGNVPESKPPHVADRKLMEKYGVALSRGQRARRKQAGIANLHYVRFDRDWLLLATHGRHEFFLEEGDRVRDVRKHPIHFAGYSLTVRKGDYLQAGEAGLAQPDGRWRVRVQVAREQLRMIKPYLLDLCTKRSATWLAYQMWNLPFEPYAPVRKQLLSLLRMINTKRQSAGMERLSTHTLRLRRRIVKPFEDELTTSAA